MTLVGDWRKNGLKLVAIGPGAVAVGFLIDACATPLGHHAEHCGWCSTTRMRSTRDLMSSRDAVDPRSL